MFQLVTLQTKVSVGHVANEADGFIPSTKHINLRMTPNPKNVIPEIRMQAGSLLLFRITSTGPVLLRMIDAAHAGPVCFPNKQIDK